jgi:hypothetical protein
MRARLLGAFVLLALLAPQPAWALCASCLGQSSRVGAALKLVGVFLLVPPAVFFAVSLAIRRLARDQGDSAPASGGGGGGGGDQAG